MSARTMTRPRLEVARQTQQERREQAQETTDRKVSGTGDIPVSAPPHTPKELQRHALLGGSGEDCINVRLLFDAGMVHCYDERLPISVVRALLDPTVENFFIPVAGTAQTKPPSTKAHYLHTAFIREVILFDVLPAEEAENERK